MDDSQDSWDPDTPGPSKQQDETPTKQDKNLKKKSDRNKKENLSDLVKTTKKRKAEDTAGMSKNEEQKTTQQKKIKESTNIPGTSQNENEIPVETVTESTKQNSERQTSQSSESKCCRKKCLHLVNSQVQEKLKQEYKEQLNRSTEFGRSYLRKYIYPSKKEKNSNGTTRPVTYHYRIPGEFPFQEDEGKKEICQKAFLKVFEVNEWALRCARDEFRKWIKNNKTGFNN